MLNANEIRSQRTDDFKSTFDFKSFDAYIEDRFKRGLTNVNIGINYARWIKKWADDNGKDCKTLSFVKGDRNGYWTTDMQIANTIYNDVVKYLHDCGFHTTAKGLCGYDDYDLLVVSL